MIYSWVANYAIAVLADGRALIGEPNKCSVSWKEMGVSDTTMMRVCQKGSTIAFLTHTGTLWVGTKTREADVIPWDQHLVCDSVAEIDDMAVGKQTVVVRAGNRFGIISITREGTTTEVYDYEQGFDLCGLYSEYIVVKTRDNHIQLIAERVRRDTPSGAFYPLVFIQPRTIEIESKGLQNIREITCRPDLIMLTVDDGSVYERRMDMYAGPSWPFRLHALPEGDSVTKISNSGNYVIYITERGRCYNTFHGGPAVFWKALPKLVPGLDELAVENVFMLRDGETLAVVHDRGKFSLLHTLPIYDRQFRHLNLSSKYYRWWKGDFKLVPVSFFDDKGVVSVTEISDNICITTEEGYVYWTRINLRDLNNAPELVRDPFFDANPLAIRTGAQHIRSAGSSLDV